MIIGMRGHDFGRMAPDALAAAIRETGFRATQLAFTKAFPAPAAQYMTPQALSGIREAFAAQGIALPVMGCYVSASDRDDAVREAAKASFSDCLRGPHAQGDHRDVPAHPRGEDPHVRHRLPLGRGLHQDEHGLFQGRRDV